MQDGNRPLLVEEMSWLEVQACVQRAALVVLPTGAIEQHGPHLPLETDSRLVWEIARTSIERVSHRAQVILAPLVPFGYSTHHRAFPGTMTLTGDTFSQVVRDLVDSLYRVGFRKVLILNGHGGNADPLYLAARSLRDRHEDILVGVANYWRVAEPAIRQLRDSPIGGMAHACEFETALMWYLRPEMVKTDKLARHVSRWKSDYMQDDLLDSGVIKVAYHFPEVSHLGVQGDPTLASPAKGAQFFGEIVEAVARMLVDFSGLELHALVERKGCS